jgi:hypothetical protein
MGCNKALYGRISLFARGIVGTRRAWLQERTGDFAILNVAIPQAEKKPVGHLPPLLFYTVRV